MLPTEELLLAFCDRRLGSVTQVFGGGNVPATTAPNS
jgi:hypothetical protein